MCLHRNVYSSNDSGKLKHLILNCNSTGIQDTSHEGVKMYGMKPKIIRSSEPEPKNHVPSRKSAFWHLLVIMGSDFNRIRKDKSNVNLIALYHEKGDDIKSLSVLYTNYYSVPFCLEN